MAGYALKEGYYDRKKLSDDEIWAAFTRLFSSRSKNDTSYKYGFLKSIMDNIYNVDKDLKLTFDQLFSKFTEIYWNLILKHGLHQKAPASDNRGSLLEQVLHEATEKYHIINPIPYEGLTDEMMIYINHAVKVKCKKYVVGALFEDTNRIFYSFSKREEWIQINPIVYEFICKHKVLIEKLNYYEWARFLEKINDYNYATKLLNKIDESSKRNNLSNYRRILFEELESKNCFYCGKKLHDGKIEVDHFIPWSFVKDDNLWNLVLSCPKCNRSKNDKLPDKAFLSDIILRNQNMVIEYKRPEMKNYQHQLLEYVYEWARVNGYDKTWCPARS